VSRVPVASVDDLEVRVAIGSDHLHSHGKDGHHEDLQRRARSVPVSAADAILVRDRRGLEKCGGPCPGRDDSGRDQARLDGAGGGVELFGRGDLVGGVSVLECGEAHHEEREHESDSQHDTCETRESILNEYSLLGERLTISNALRQNLSCSGCHG
jgi:hypothetical protein